MTVEEIYALLATTLHSGIHSGFKSAELAVQRTPAMVGFEGTYQSMQDERRIVEDLLVTPEASKAVHELHALTTEGEPHTWNRLLVRLMPTGEFGIDYFFDAELDAEVAFYRAGGKPQEWLAKKKVSAKTSKPKAGKAKTTKQKNKAA